MTHVLACVFVLPSELLGCCEEPAQPRSHPRQEIRPFSVPPPLQPERAAPTEAQDPGASAQTCALLSENAAAAAAQRMNATLLRRRRERLRIRHVSSRNRPREVCAAAAPGRGTRRADSTLSAPEPRCQGSWFGGWGASPSRLLYFSRSLGRGTRMGCSGCPTVQGVAVRDRPRTWRWLPQSRSGSRACRACEALLKEWAAASRRAANSRGTSPLVAPDAGSLSRKNVSAPKRKTFRKKNGYILHFPRM